MAKVLVEATLMESISLVLAAIAYPNPPGSESQGNLFHGGTSLEELATEVLEEVDNVTNRQKTIYTSRVPAEG